MRITAPHIHRLNIRSDYGGLGDQIARLPVFAKTIRENPAFFITIFMQDFATEVCDQALKENLGPEIYNWQVIPMSLYEKARTITNTFEVDFKGVNINSLRMKLTQHANLIVNNEVIEDIKYLTLKVDSSARACKEPYVVVPTGFTAPARELPVGVINEIISGLLESGLKPVLLGASSNKTGELSDIKADFNESINADSTVDLRNKTTLVECFNYLGNAEMVLGLDNGLLHLASMSDVPVIWAFSSVKPEHRVPLRSNGKNYVIEPSSDCRYCQSDNMYLIHDYRVCYWADKEKPKVKPYACTSSLTSKQFLGIVSEILKEKHESR